ncbi:MULTISPECIES: hypothetical protein [Arthrobacter]|uniref:Uncharacterized protein n=1 Tax=Arthrobacter terricola TaxID=2547396 RepID=A0A4R5K6Z1_9MICC|nr:MULTISPECIES: hypothetical protein [Arthrobacter]MBT8163057.1 hypothetical protein [Arthrobacter sp. GN70]TDF88097.1 hypothetical protein E1809_24060 [Arthrobacter terricola]
MNKIKAFIAVAEATLTMKLRELERSADRNSFENRLARMTSPSEREAYKGAFIMLVQVGLTPDDIEALATAAVQRAAGLYAIPHRFTAGQVGP